MGFPMKRNIKEVEPRYILSVPCFISTDALAMLWDGQSTRREIPPSRNDSPIPVLCSQGRSAPTAGFKLNPRQIAKCPTALTDPCFPKVPVHKAGHKSNLRLVQHVSRDPTNKSLEDYV